MTERQPSGQTGMVPSDERAGVELVLPEGREFDAVGRLVAAGMGARSGLQLDRIEDLQLALEAVRRRQGGHGATTMSFAHADGDLRVGVGPLHASEAGPALEGVLSSLVDEVSRRPNGEEWIVLHVANPADEGR